MKKAMRMGLAVVAATTLAAKSETVTFQQGANGYAGTTDTVLWPGPSYGSPTQDYNFGARNRLDSGMALLKFDNIFGLTMGQISATAQVIQATAKIYCYGGWNTSSAYVVSYPMLKPWVEGNSDWSPASPDEPTYTYRQFNTAAWGNNDSNAGPVSTGVSPDYLNGDGVGHLSSTMADATWISFDVTDYVIAWQRSFYGQSQQAGDILAPMTNDGVLIKNYNSGGSTPNYYSRNYAEQAYRPLLEIVVIPEPASLALLGLGGLFYLRQSRR